MLKALFRLVQPRSFKHGEYRKRFSDDFVSGLLTAHEVCDVPEDRVQINKGTYCTALALPAGRPPFADHIAAYWMLATAARLARSYLDSSRRL